MQRLFAKQKDLIRSTFFCIGTSGIRYNNIFKTVTIAMDLCVVVSYHKKDMMEWCSIDFFLQSVIELVFYFVFGFFRQGIYLNGAYLGVSTLESS